MPPAINRPQKITFAEMRSSGVRGIPDLLLGLPVQPSCRACGKRGADVRPDFSWNAKPVGGAKRSSWPSSRSDD